MNTPKQIVQNVSLVSFGWLLTRIWTHYDMFSFLSVAAMVLGFVLVVGAKK